MKALLPLVLLAPIQEARWELHPREALIGEPVRATLLVRTEGAVQAGLEDVELSLGYEWFVLDDGRASTTQAPGEGVSSRTWTVMCLEPGALFWPEVTVPLEGGEVDSILAAPLELEVAPELGQGEDSARPLPGFHAVEERVGPLRAWHALLLAAGVLLLWMFRRLTAKRTVQSATESAPRVESLAPPDTSSPEATVEFAWSLAAALRAAALHTASLHAASLHSASFIRRLSVTRRVTCARASHPGSRTRSLPRSWRAKLWMRTPPSSSTSSMPVRASSSVESVQRASRWRSCSIDHGCWPAASRVRPMGSNPPRPRRCSDDLPGPGERTELGYRAPRAVR